MSVSSKPLTFLWSYSVNVLTSFNYGKPYVFTIGTGQVIKGMDIGLTGVCVGDALKITIPSHLAYGNRATGSIPANSDLIFYVKVLRLDRVSDYTTW